MRAHALTQAHSLADEDKTIDNALALLCQLYNLKVIQIVSELLIVKTIFTRGHSGTLSRLPRSPVLGRVQRSGSISLSSGNQWYVAPRGM